MSFVKIGQAAAILCLRACINWFPNFLISWLIWIKLDIRHLHVLPLSVGKAILHSGTRRNFSRTFGIYCSIWVKFGIRDLFVTLLVVNEFRDICRREGRAFRMDVNEIAITFVQQTTNDTFESKWRPCKVWVLGRGVHHLQSFQFWGFNSYLVEDLVRLGYKTASLGSSVSTFGMNVLPSLCKSSIVGSVVLEKNGIRISSLRFFNCVTNIFFQNFEARWTLVVISCWRT